MDKKILEHPFPRKDNSSKTNNSSKIDNPSISDNYPKIGASKTGGFRKISRDKYILAGIITFLIFSLGLTLGSIFEDQRYNLVEEINLEQDVKFLSLQMQYLFLNSFSNYNNCPILAATLKEAIKDIDDSLKGIIEKEEDNNYSPKRGQLVQRRYILDNLRYWILARESKQKCDLDITTILYFYSTDCPSCPTQGTILTYYRQLFGDKVLVFPINLDLRSDEPLVEIMIAQHEVDVLPTVIIDDQKYEGVIKKEDMGDIICQSLKNATQCG